MVRAYFVKALDNYTERLNNTGWKQDELDLLRQEVRIHEDGIAGFDDLSDQYLDIQTVGKFKSVNKISDAQWAESETDLRREMRKGRHDQLKAFLRRAESVDEYDLASAAQTPHKGTQGRSVTLAEAFDDFMAESLPEWSDQMAGKARSFMAVPLEFFGPERPLADITRQDANELKKLLQKLPLNRNTRPETRGLPLIEAVKVEGVPKVSLETVNNHIGMFIRFWDWAERHTLTPHKLFVGMKIKRGKQKKSERKAYSKDQTAKLYAELTQNHCGLVKKDDHKWGALLAMFTGARLNEVAQLEAGDIANEDGIWFINITDDGDNKKRVKANASRRKVPIHSELIRLGFLDWVTTISDGPRLFMSFSYDAKDGYGRNLGRWFNTRFLTGLGIKEDGLVFHSLRHTVVTRMRQAGVELALVQEIVGHERGSVTDGYFGEGYTLAQKQDAIEKFEV